MWFRMADWIKNIGKIPNDFTLFNELCAPTFSHNESGKLQLEKKADIKKRLGYSPDLADAIALTFAENLNFSLQLVGKSKMRVIMYKQYSYC